MTDPTPVTGPAWVRRNPWKVVVALVIFCSTVSYGFGRFTTNQEACKARATFERGHNKLVDTFGALGSEEIDANRQGYPPEEVARRRELLKQFINETRVPLEEC